MAIGIKPVLTYPLEGSGFAGALFTGPDDPFRIAAGGIDSSLLMTLAPDPAGVYAFPESIEINAKGQVLSVTAGSGSGAPTIIEQLAQTVSAGGGVAITGLTAISTAIVVVSGIVQHGADYTLAAGSVSFSFDLSDDAVKVIFWN